MKIEKLDFDFTVCKVSHEDNIDLNTELCFVAKTDEEISLVCPTESTPSHTTDREDGWKAFRIKGVLDFSLIGILSEISTLLAKNGIGIFAVSTYNTDYILVKAENYQKSLDVLQRAGHEIL